MRIGRRIGRYVGYRIGVSHVGAVLNPLPDLPDLPTSPTDSQILDYSGLGLSSAQVDTVIIQLYDDGYCTNCIIDLSDNSVPTAESSTELAGLRASGGQNNTVIIDSV